MTDVFQMTLGHIVKINFLFVYISTSLSMFTSELSSEEAAAVCNNARAVSGRSRLGWESTMDTINYK